MKIPVLLVVIGVLLSTAPSQSIHGRDGITLPPPPVAEPNPVIDNYFGTHITDNYRWLENAKSPETRSFIDEENAYTTR
jgi:prolyl oligopeptidase